MGGLRCCIPIHAALAGSLASSLAGSLAPVVGAGSPIRLLAVTVHAYTYVQLLNQPATAFNDCRYIGSNGCR